jgi:hypothetical protein
MQRWLQLAVEIVIRVDLLVIQTMVLMTMQSERCQSEGTRTSQRRLMLYMRSGVVSPCFWLYVKNALKRFRPWAILSLRGRNEVGVFLNGRFKPRPYRRRGPSVVGPPVPAITGPYDWRKDVRVGCISQKPQLVPRSDGGYQLGVP